MGTGLSTSVMAAVILLLIATLSAIFFKRLRIPYTIGLVFVGIVLAFICNRVDGLEAAQNIKLNHDLIMYVLLPALIFSASVNIDTKLLFKNLSPTLLLAAPGLVISTILVGVIMFFFTPLELGGAMLFGALISATDPVAVISLFEIIGAPRRLRILVDGESLFNDATAIVMYTIIKSIVVAGAAFSVGTFVQGGIDFIIIFLGGLAVGAVIGFIMVQIILFAENDFMVEVALSTVVAYAAFIVADKVFNTSGVMAALGAGMVINHYGMTRFTPKIKEYMRQFWDFVAFVANSFIFLLLGFTEDFYLIDTNAMSITLRHIMWGIIAIQISRALIVFGICPLLGRRNKEEKIDIKYQLIMFWGGLRGAVPLALVFSLPPDLPHRVLIIEITLGVVAFTLFFQGTTVKVLMRMFNLDKPTVFMRFSELHAMLMARRQGLKRIQDIASTGKFPHEIVSAVEEEYKMKISDQKQRLSEALKYRQQEEDAVKRTVWSRVIFAERKSFNYLFQCGFINERLYRRIDFHAAQLLESIITTSKLPTTITHDPLVMRLESIAFRILRCFPIPYHIINRFRTKALLDDYLTLCSTMIGANQALEEIDKLEETEFFKVYKEILSECRTFYKGLSDRVFKTLASLESKNFDLLRAVTTATLRDMIYSTEIGVLQDLADSGEITEHICDHLTEMIRLQIVFNRKQVYSKALEDA
ncbi:MAG: sodium:proton antiporter [Lentisphaerae bacterium]|nr:sodium:proton antiporter [Lentisphaerota bacterium]MCP4101807.1 sodium:proton antiporter [Lentisphaerota bacterium]